MSRKLTVALLVLLLGLGVAIAAYGDSQDQGVTGQIDCSVTVTDPTDISNWALTSGTDNTQDSNITIDTNCPYDLAVKVSSTANPAGETTPDQYMTGDDSSNTDLTNAFKVHYLSGATSVDSSLSTATAITTPDQTLVSCPETPGDGQDVISARFTQTVVIGDAAYEQTTQINYAISLTWTVSSDIT